MATVAELKELALHAVNGTAPANFEHKTVDEALRGEMNQWCSSLIEFQRHKLDIFEIIITAVDEVVPNKVIDAMGMFAEIRQVADGQKALFKRGLVGRNRAKKFITRVGLGGDYESFRLDNETFELGAYAIGSAVSIDFERFLDGSDSLVDLMDVVTEGMTDAVFGEVQKALISAANAVGRPNANKVIHAGFDGDQMFKLVSVVKAYGGNAAIFATPEFVGEMGPDAIVPVAVAGTQAVYHPSDIDAIHNNGYVNIFRGTPIVQLPQSFVDENNTQTWLNPQYAYVLPAGKEKVVKIVFEGKTQMWDSTNKDRSYEFNTYKKMGAAVMTHNNWGIYQNTNIPDTSYFPYGV